MNFIRNYSNYYLDLDNHSNDNSDPSKDGDFNQDAVKDLGFSGKLAELLDEIYCHRQKLKL